MRQTLREELERAFETGAEAYADSPADLAAAIEALDVGPDSVEKATAETIIKDIMQHRDLLINEATSQLMEDIDSPAGHAGQPAIAVPDGGSIICERTKGKLYLSLGGFETVAAMYIYNQVGTISAAAMAAGALCFFLAYLEQQHVNTVVEDN